jgi:diguanylate cyclase (GGDEF)-like protein/PAS domain S-box-containing protein
VPSVDAFSELPPLSFVPPTRQNDVRQRHQEVLSGRRQQLTVLEQVLSREGVVRDLETTMLRFEYGGRPAVMVFGRDVTDRRVAEDAARAAEQRFAAAFQVASTGMLLLNAEGAVLDANAAMRTAAGADPSQLVGRSSLELLHPEDRDTFRAWLQALGERTVNVVSGELRVVAVDGSQTWVFAALAPLPGEPATFIVHLMDITERRENEARLAHQALHDPLTGLPNRALLFDRLALAVRSVDRGSPGVAVLYLDLNNFKEINDTHGHAAGDRVLVEVAQRLVGALRPSDTVARLGGDEYAVVAELPEPAAHELAQRITQVLSSPVGEFVISASVGVAHTENVPPDVDALVRAADADMYRAKQRSRGPEG